MRNSVKRSLPRDQLNEPRIPYPHQAAEIKLASAGKFARSPGISCLYVGNYAETWNFPVKNDQQY
jgi:hypothetical protein